MSVGERLRKARLARSPRMTLAELAGDRLSISLISKIERGLVQPSLATLAYLADRLGLPLQALVGGDERAPAVERQLALERARLALQDDEPAAALALIAGMDGDQAAVVGARALLALGRDDEAAALLQPTPAADPEVALLRAELLAGSAPRHRAQDAYGRALALLDASQSALRAEALVGLARLAEAAGEPATARNLYQQAVAELGSAASPARRQLALARRAGELAAAGDALGALRHAAAAAELGAAARAATLRAELAARVAEVGRTTSGGAPDTRFREADEAMRHRSIRPPPSPPDGEAG